MKNSRVRTWVNRYQSILVRRMLVYWVVFQLAVVNILFIWGYLNQTEQTAGEYLVDFVPSMVPMFVCFLFLAPFFCRDAVRLSHRLVGPLVRVRDALRTLAAGEYTERIEFRKDDFAQELKDDLNALIDVLKARGYLPASETRVVRPNAIGEDDEAHPPLTSAQR